MPTHFENFLAASNQSPGVFLIAQLLSIGRAMNLVLMVWEASRPDEWRDLCTHLPL